MNDIIAEAVSRLFLSYFNRLPTSAELRFWSYSIESRKGDLSLAMMTFSLSPEHQRRMDGSSMDMISNTISDLFDRAPTSEEVDFWQRKLDTSLVNTESLPWVLQAVASGEDASTFEAKLKVNLVGLGDHSGEDIV